MNSTTRNPSATPKVRIRRNAPHPRLASRLGARRCGVRRSRRSTGPARSPRGGAANRSSPLRITSQQQRAIDTPTFTSTYDRLAGNYNTAQTTGTRFQDLPPSAQTAIFSVAHQYGTDLAARTPNFWNQVTTGRWQDAYDNLQNFGDAHPTRRREEGRRMLDAIHSGNLPAPRLGR